VTLISLIRADKKQSRPEEYNSAMPSRRLLCLALSLLFTVSAWPQSTAEETLRRANESYAKGDHDRAIQEYTESIRLEPNYAAFVGRGNAYDDKGDHDRAIQDYNEALRLHPSDAMVLYNRGLAFANKGDHDRAIQDYSEAIRLKPGVPEMFNNRGQAYARKGQPDQAIKDYGEAIRLRPEFEQAIYNRGLAYEHSGDTQHAMEDYSEVLRLNPADVGALVDRGVLYAKKRENGLAIKDLEEAVRLNSKEGSAFYDLAQVYDNQGDYERAGANYTEALKLSPGDDAALLKRARIYLMKLDYDRAIRDFSEIIRKNPNHTHALEGRGIANFYAGPIKEAQQDLDTAVRVGRGKTTSGTFAVGAKGMEMTFTSGLDPYMVIWSYLARTKTGADAHIDLKTDDLKKNSEGLDLNKWPGPVIQMFLGKTKPDDLLHASGDDPRRKCESSFYVGKYHDIHGKGDEAVTLFESARATCPAGLLEKMTAQAELKQRGK
jgi:tetratricopeptide (TPR) repeat protein